MKLPGPTAIEGIWQMVRAELDGETAPELVTTKSSFELRDGGYVMRFDGEIVDRGTLAFDTAAGSFLLRGTEGTNAGRTIPCIYQMVGERLRICFGLDETAPTQFATGPESRRYLVTYRPQRD
jgi:uncharacterized protein (TIGR03067 family)